MLGIVLCHCTLSIYVGQGRKKENDSGASPPILSEAPDGAFISEPESLPLEESFTIHLGWWCVCLFVCVCVCVCMRAWGGWVGG